MGRIGYTALEEKLSDNVDGWTTDRRWTHAYTTSSPMSLISSGEVTIQVKAESRSKQQQHSLVPSPDDKKVCL